MTKSNKTRFLILSVVVPILAYCFIYYHKMVKNAPYKFSEFKSIVFQYGPGDSLINQYDSRTGDYQYMLKNGTLVKKNVKLTYDDLLYLHRKAVDLGFWDFPEKETTDSIVVMGGVKSSRYLIEFSYKRKTKKVIFDDAYDGNEILKDANQRLIREIMKVLDKAEERQKK